MNLLSYNFSKFPSVQSLTLMDAVEKYTESEKMVEKLTKAELDSLFTPFDLKRLESYSRNLIDYHVILDLIPSIAYLYFTNKISEEVNLSHVQSAILLAIGLQHKDIDTISKELNVESNQSMAMFAKTVRKVSKHLRTVVSSEIAKEIPIKEVEVKETVDEQEEYVDVAAMEQELEDDLNTAGDEAVKELRDKQRELINSLNLSQYEIKDTNAENWDDETLKKAVTKGSGVVSLKSGKKRKSESAAEILEQETKSGKKKNKKNHKSKK
ncbi:unnamed protein product [Ambrosiozyma monospora]|uniref:Unnamed protein product n=1 Tax=Ambrosiozyma monospora TaxID=43982 RepID=A0ACB5SUF5_AMBMO|nr:unnamed protein product [Ambrosiozyma monospora]